MNSRPFEVSAPFVTPYLPSTYKCPIHRSLTVESHKAFSTRTIYSRTRYRDIFLHRSTTKTNPIFTRSSGACRRVEVNTALLQY